MLLYIEHFCCIEFENEQYKYDDILYRYRQVVSKVVQITFEYVSMIKPIGI
jgi:hypothetical protein